ncbi:hypothetical protein AB4099_32735 [Bosea sp. 2KB_26]|uniref:hypothetical protein n=1 Tax=Bosea sp. 2KB_26 TaxID=3237475 RepID=UPI000DE355C9
MRRSHPCLGGPAETIASAGNACYGPSCSARRRRSNFRERQGARAALAWIARVLLALGAPTRHCFSFDTASPKRPFT